MRRPRSVRRGAVLAGALALAGGVLATGILVGLDRGGEGDTARPSDGKAPRPTAVSPVVRPEEHGAVGDGQTDDAAALQRALDALVPGQELALEAGRVYRHDTVLVVRSEGARMVGPGTLLAGVEERSALQVAADDVELADLTLATATPSRRWSSSDQHRLVLRSSTGVKVRRVVVEDAAAAGIFVAGARDFLLEDVQVTGSRADGIHLTRGSTDGVVRRPVVRRSGDDGVAVVSYDSDPASTERITIESPRVHETTWGRGVTVVGGRDIVYRDVLVEGSSAAAVYVATEGDPYFTRDVANVQVLGAVLRGANHNPRVDHGAVLVVNGREGGSIRDVLVEGVVIEGTRPDAARQVGVLGRSGSVAGVVLRDVEVRGGGHLEQVTAGSDCCRTSDWTVDGRPVRDPIG